MSMDSRHDEVEGPVERQYAGVEGQGQGTGGFPVFFGCNPATSELACNIAGWEHMNAYFREMGVSWDFSFVWVIVK